jgi:hypothetical protein
MFWINKFTWWCPIIAFYMGKEGFVFVNENADFLEGLSWKVCTLNSEELISK